MFYKQNPLTVGELKQILVEMDIRIPHSNKQEKLQFTLKRHPVFGQMRDRILLIHQCHIIKLIILMILTLGHGFTRNTD